jgi:hypothetical protein
MYESVVVWDYNINTSTSSPILLLFRGIRPSSYLSTIHNWIRKLDPEPAAGGDFETAIELQAMESQLSRHFRISIAHFNCFFRNQQIGKTWFWNPFRLADVVGKISFKHLLRPLTQ